MPVRQLKQPPVRVSNVNGNPVGRNNKAPLPLPPADASPPLSSLIHCSPNGGYVSLLRRAVAPKSGDPENRPTAAVRFNSLQRPNRGATTAWQRRDRQFRSMRTVGTDSDKTVEKPIDRTLVGEGRQDNNNNNNNGGGDDETKATADRRDDPKNSFAAATFPKPAPRTRVPSASAAPPSLARRDTYENLQQLLNGDNSVVGDSKVRNGGPRQSLL